MTRMRVLKTSARLLTLVATSALLTACAGAWEQAGKISADGPPAVFTARNGQIFTPQGQPFHARGVNLQYGDRPRQAFPAIRAIQGTGANLIRLQLRRNTTAAQLRRALDEAVRLNMPVMVFYWESDITCASDSAILRRDVEKLWLDRWSGVLREARYQPYLMLNIANEWGTSKDGFADYMATYTGLIKAMRAEGFRAPIVIDAADCGQATQSFLDGRGQALYAADPLNNLIVSVHAYHHLWNTREEIDGHIDALKATGVPFVLGEFGSLEMDAPDNGVDAVYLMQTASAKDVGWMAWSWKGNGGASKVLDMSRQYGTADLTPHGKDVVAGIRSGM